MSDIFISYSSEDKGRVQALARALERKGWSVWWDRRIPAGKSFDEVIHEALKAARSVVVVWTNTSVKSTWVKNESRSGLRRGILFPVMLLDEVEIPLEFEHLQAAHLMDWHPDQGHAGFDQFIDDIAQLIGTPTNSVLQQPPATQGQEPLPAPTSPTPEPDREPLPQHTDDVEPAGGQLDEQPSTPDTTVTVVSADVPTAPVGPGEELPAASSPPTPQREMAAKSRKSKRRGTRPRVTGAKQPTVEARAVAQDLAGEPLVSPEPTEGAELIHTDQSAGADYSDYPTHPVVSTSSFSVLPIGLGLLAAIGALAYFLIFSKSPSPQYQPTTQSTSAPTEVMRPPTQFVPVEQPPVAAPQAKPTTTQATTAIKTTDTKSRQTARPSKTQEPSTQATVTKSQPAVDSPTNITGKDGAPMVLIPAGKFWMGSPDSEGRKDEHPRHQIYLDAFYMDKFEVTVARYTEFVRAQNRSKPHYWDQVDTRTHRNLPVVGVDWHDAKAYCEWAGKRLPTEAEWEKAARGTDGRTYPWGNEQPTVRLANFGQHFTTNLYDDPLAPVDSYEAGNSPYGLHHMAGNVWEWTADWYDENYYRKGPERNPTGPANGKSRVVRGGSWSWEPADVRSAYRQRNLPTERGSNIGFRCAQDVPQ
ncbi:MAG: SUMF1/EgtB/PvdO family nonheme iron enzyme [Nitrospira sp.]|nr:SUMF1/EgtB/PvdO family nonheme iron enzyme [Nitrospira sp.]